MSHWTVTEMLVSAPNTLVHGAHKGLLGACLPKPKFIGQIISKCLITDCLAKTKFVAFQALYSHRSFDFLLIRLAAQSDILFETSV